MKWVRQWANAPVLIAVDIGGTKTALMVADAHTHEMLALERFKTDRDAAPERTAHELKRQADALLEREGLSKRRVRAVGAAVPGQVDHAR